MFEFIKGQYVMGKISADKVKSYCPKYITEEQVEEILQLPKEE